MSERIEGVPRYLNEAYVESILRAIENSEKVKLEKYELRPATKNGDHYASVMVRIVADYVIDVNDHKQISIILKTSYDQVFENNGTVEMTKKYDVQNREMLMYGKILNDFHNLLSSINDNIIFSARCYYEDKATKSLFFEDLVVRDYICANRVQRLDVAHAKLALRKLAKYHASSIILKEKEPGIYEECNKAFLGRDYPDGTEFCLKNFDALLLVVSKSKKFRDVFIEKGIKLYEPDEYFNVLLHGDFWSNNMMFKYDNDGNPIDVLFVDYQLPYWSSPAIDVLYFIHTSLKEELRLKTHDELVQFYYKHLKETLIDGFKYKGKFPSLHEFHIMILKKSLQIFFAAFIVQPVVLMDESIRSDMFLLMERNHAGMKFSETMYSNPHVIMAIKNLLPVLDARGIFD
ncbi:hypothetical protein DMENIID0001_021190 [Sergentomyia squamirostris]